MIIMVTAAAGRGPTELAAFDAALVAAGVADRNLLYLSSVHRVDRIDRTPGDWGDRLYCVVAQAGATEPGAQAWAGVGWVQDESGRGLLVEHHAADEAAVRALVRTSLDALCRNRGVSFPSAGTCVFGTSAERKHSARRSGRSSDPLTTSWRSAPAAASSPCRLRGGRREGHGGIERGTVTRATRVTPAGYRTELRLVAVDERMYGHTIKARTRRS